MSKLDDKIDEIEVTESEKKKKQAKGKDVIIFKDRIEMPMIPLRGISISPCILQSFDIGTVSYTHLRGNH